MTDVPSLFDLTREELAERIKALGERPFRADQVFLWTYQRRARQFSAMTDLSGKLRRTLAENFSLSLPKVAEASRSRDRTVKLLLELDDGNFVESVLIPMREHHTLCISSQVGCRWGCGFCLTGRRRFVRNLRTSEIVGQVAACDDSLLGQGHIANIVFMGQGEPLENLDHVLKAVRILRDDFGYGFGPRRVTVSTCGIPSGIERFGAETDVNLAVSLNAADDEVRSALMPVNRKHPLRELMEALRRYPPRPRRSITFEYVALAGINDSLKDADNLAKLLRGIRSKVNLIPFNSYPGAAYRTPSGEALLAFQERLLSHGVTAMIRASRGSDILAACGQLAGKRTGFAGRSHA